MFSETLYQNIKDINFESKSQRADVFPPNIFVVSEYQRYKFRKQITTDDDVELCKVELYQNIKDINFESKSQLMQLLMPLPLVVSEYQRYKFRKQITTIGNVWSIGTKLYQNIKDINFESKSQPIFVHRD